MEERCGALIQVIENNRERGCTNAEIEDVAHEMGGVALVLRESHRTRHASSKRLLSDSNDALADAASVAIILLDPALVVRLAISRTSWPLAVTILSIYLLEVAEPTCGLTVVVE